MQNVRTYTVLKCLPVIENTVLVILYNLILIRESLFVWRDRKAIIVVFIISDFCEIAKIARQIWL